MRLALRRFALATTLPLLTSAARAQCSEWSEQFVGNGTTGREIEAQLAHDDGSGPALFVGGGFTTIAGQLANGIAKWDGAQWTTFGDGALSNSQTGGVHCFAVFDDGSGPALFAGGEFTAIGGVPASNIAKWNGTSWSALGAGTNGDVAALCVFDDGGGPSLFVGGVFTQAGGAPAGQLAKWNGSSWSAVPAGFTSFGGPPRVAALAVHDDGGGLALYVGGSFTSVAGLANADNVAKWNGALWSPLGFGVSGEVRAFATFDEGAGPRLFLAGSITFINGAGGWKAIARWDGSWLTGLGTGSGVDQSRLWPIDDLEVFDAGFGPRLFMVGESSPYVFVGTYAALETWDGASWVPAGGGGVLLDTPFEPWTRSLAIYDEGSGDRLFVGGRFAFANGALANGITSWAGGAWSTYGVNAAPNRVTRDFALFDDGGGEKLFVCGDFNAAGPIVADHVAGYDGATWTSTGASMSPYDTVHALATFDDGNGDDLYAAGGFASIGGINAARIARWNGASWSALGAGIGGGNTQYVSSLLVHDDGSGSALYVGGAFTVAGGVGGTNRVARWNGASWSKLGTGVGGEVLELGEFVTGGGAQLIAGGNFTLAGGNPANFIASWDGLGWSALGSGTDAPVRAVVTFDDGSGPALYAGGDFTLAGGVAASRIARWDGSTWSDVGGGVNGAVEALGVYDDGSGAALYVAGATITSAGATPVRAIARWDGVQWSALDVGLTAFATHALATYDDGSGSALFVAGELLTAGGVPSRNLAKWQRACSCAPTSYCTAGTTSNGCNAHISGIGTPSASAGSGFDLVVGNVEGQRTGLIFYGTGGAKSDPWGSGSSFVCVKFPLQRTGNQSSGGTSGACDGVLMLDLNTYLASHPAALGQPFTAVTTLWAQAWFRDPPAPKGTSLSDALRFDVCP